jgi:hypothetical protein
MTNFTVFYVCAFVCVGGGRVCLCVCVCVCVCARMRTRMRVPRVVPCSPAHARAQACVLRVCARVCEKDCTTRLLHCKMDAALMVQVTGGEGAAGCGRTHAGCHTPGESW